MKERERQNGAAAVGESESELTAFRLPTWLSDMARHRCRAEDLTLSQLMRRAVRKELGLETAERPD